MQLDGTALHTGVGLRDFFAQLAVDDELLAAFIRDPQRTMRCVGLDVSSRDALETASARAIWTEVLRSDESCERQSWTDTYRRREPVRDSLVVVGTGIRAVGQLTMEAVAWIRECDIVLYLVADPAAEEAIRRLNSRGARSLLPHYRNGVTRPEIYESIVREILECVRQRKRTCVALYGHPGIFSNAAHEAIRRARAEGYSARMLPGISAEDCLFADLGVDPADNGCRSMDASDFLLHESQIDPTSALILWQIGLVGDSTYRSRAYVLDAFPLLVAKLMEQYSAKHEATVYEAAVFVGLEPRAQSVALEKLTSKLVSPASTLYIPPLHAKVRDLANRAELSRIREIEGDNGSKQLATLQ